MHTYNRLATFAVYAFASLASVSANANVTIRGNSTCPTSRNDAILDTTTAPFTEFGPQDQQFIEDRKRAAVSIQYKNFELGIERNKTCSGTLVGPDLILTAAHCFEAPRFDHVVIFDAESMAGDLDFSDAPRYDVSHVVELGDRTGDGYLDYALVRISGNAADELAIEPTPVRFYRPWPDARVWMFAHPFSEGWDEIDYSDARKEDPDFVLPKRVAMGQVHRNADSSLGGGTVALDTTILAVGGASGAGILDEDGYVIGIYYSGADDGGGTPRCSRSSVLWYNQRVSWLLRELESPKLHAVNLRAFGDSTRDAAMYLWCGSERAQFCGTTVDTYADFDTFMRTGCTVTCPLGSTVHAGCYVGSQSLPFKDLVDMRKYHVQVDNAGSDYDLFLQSQDACPASSCVHAYEVQTTTELRCKFEGN